MLVVGTVLVRLLYQSAVMKISRFPDLICGRRPKMSIALNTGTGRDGDSSRLR